ncbi:MAG: hypothetical protein J6Q82_07790, partial [Clostridia bacterium]|nr:hypothetical protein [Clostridia bacterium]
AVQAAVTAAGGEAKGVYTLALTAAAGEAPTVEENAAFATAITAKINEIKDDVFNVTTPNKGDGSVQDWADGVTAAN